MSKPLPVLMYHAYQSDLEDHLNEIRDLGYSTRQLNEVENYLTQPETESYPEYTVVLTFDDAYQDFYDLVRPLLQQYEMTATICAPTGFISNDKDSRRQSAWENREALYETMTWNELKTLADEGFEIIPHSVSHISFDLIEANPDLVQCEIQYSKKALTTRLGIPSIKMFCLPYGAGWGKFNQILLDEGFSGALRAEFRPQDTWDAFRIPRWELRGERTFSDVLREIQDYGF